MYLSEVLPKVPNFWAESVHASMHSHKVLVPHIGNSQEFGAADFIQGKYLIRSKVLRFTGLEVMYLLFGAKGLAANDEPEPSQVASLTNWPKGC